MSTLTRPICEYHFALSISTVFKKFLADLRISDAVITTKITCSHQYKGMRLPEASTVSNWQFAAFTSCRNDTFVFLFDIRMGWGV